MNSGDYECDGRTQEDQRKRQAEAASRQQQLLLKRQQEIEAADRARKSK